MIRRLILPLLMAMALSAGAGTVWADGPVYSVDSTAYSDQGLTASGMWTGDGIVAVLPGHILDTYGWGTRVQILDGPLAGKVVIIQDHIGWGSQFDVWLPSEGECLQYGRRQIHVQVLVDPPAPADPVAARIAWAKQHIDQLLDQYGAVVKDS